MALTGALKNYPLTSYTNSTWTDIANPGADFMATDISVSNTTGGAINAAIRLVDSGGTERFRIMVAQAIAAGESLARVRQLAMESGHKIQGWADAAGIQFLVAGSL